MYQYMMQHNMSNFVLNDYINRKVDKKMSLSERVKNLTPSSTLAISALASELKQQGHDVIGLGVGEPDFNTPDYIIEAAKKRSEEHTSELQSRGHLVCRLLLEK